MSRTGHRRRLDVVATRHAPVYVVWELTLACDHACTHCGSRAGVAREHELSTAEAVGVAGQLADAGAREVILIGGEAYLHDGFLDVVRALADRGVTVGLTTGGRGVTAELARAMAAAGLGQASVSVDGLEATHDRMRHLRGSFAGAMAALANLRAAGVAITANTNLNRSNRDDLEPLYDHLRAQGIVAWQVQLTAPLGRAADRVQMILQPWDLLDLVPRIAALKQRARGDGITLMPGNNLGYFGPEETLLRSLRAGDRDHWRGCQAGKFVMGIESDGAVKGCPSLQTRAYVGGNLRERTLAAIWKDAPELAFNRARTVDDLWGFCRTCDFAAECLGGCTFTAHAILGRPGNNPYCHYRARVHARRGQRERLVPGAAADGLPFDNGVFEVVVEPLDAPDPAAAVADLVQITRRPARRA
ncbi:MAG: radical SAM protein [Kofleriaceae bacterium]|nr:radical SAM protein [Kofleriaceae bacterium]MCL4228904.1 radical SAM protein [Myxococcales bacterium]